MATIIANSYIKEGTPVTMERLKTDTQDILFDDLKPNKRFDFEFRPGPQANQALSKELGVSNISKLRLKGKLSAFGGRGWFLKAHLGASVIQTCVISLQPVKTRIEVSVSRKFLEMSETMGNHIGLHQDAGLQQDESIEPLGAGIKLTELVRETLLLELPLYPKAKDAKLQSISVNEEVVKSMDDQDIKPFAGLASLKDKLKK